MGWLGFIIILMYDGGFFVLMAGVCMYVSLFSNFLNFFFPL